jgi:hypothetical protein
MFNKGQLAGLMKQAQAMQDNLKKAQDELAFVEVEGSSGSGMVKVLMTCKHAVKRVTSIPHCWRTTRTCWKIWWLQLSMMLCVKLRKSRNRKWAN